MAAAPPTVFKRLSFAVESEARFLLHVPDSMPLHPILAVVTHGYGMSPEEMLRLVLPAVGDDKVIASIEAPHQFYLSDKPGSGPVGYNWGTTADWKGVVSIHHKIVLGTASICAERFDISPQRTLLLGFSQPVGLNYRLIATHPERFRGVAAICGGIPRDWEDPSYHPVSAALLHIARDNDEYFPAETVAAFPARLRSRAPDVEFHLLPGPHRFPSNAAQILRPWMARVVPT